ncbi:hypothetical protein [Collimonas silvisoli]|uniref:hypothetical protein n=1 Tax=Collimonas silvisoli TaxID=2825884 RepID=UPI001B8BF498|nr:hypothetical protein [Collimonas silvisoli]
MGKFQSRNLQFCKKSDRFVNRLLSDASETLAKLKTGFFRSHAISCGAVLEWQFVTPLENISADTLSNKHATKHINTETMPLHTKRLQQRTSLGGAIARRLNDSKEIILGNGRTQVYSAYNNSPSKQ